MANRKIDFPDHTADDFDPDVVVTHNDIDYAWNGEYGWEVVCKGSGSIEEYDDEWIKDDQQRQDEALADYKDEVTLEQERQDKDLADYKDEQVIDQQRQDDELQDLKDEIWPDFDDPCPQPEVSAQLKFGEYANGMPADVVYFASTPGNGKNNLLTVPEGVHGGNWPYPSGTDAVWINGEEYVVTETGNASGVHWKYYLDREIDFSLQNTVVKFRLCEPFNPPAAIFVTHEELALNQQSQDEAFAKDQKRQDDELQVEIVARAERDALHDAQLNTLEYKLDALVGLTFKGTYEFKHEADCDAAYQACMSAANGDPTAASQCSRDQVACETDKVRPGYFEAVDPDDQFDHLEQIIISKSDVDGAELDWSGVLDEGDYLEVDHSLKGELDKRNYGLYRITEEPEHTANSQGEDVYVIKLQFLQGDGVLAEGEVYEIRGITAAEGVNPEELGDFLTKDEASNLYALKTHSHAWNEITGKPSTFNPGSNYHSKGSNKNILLNDHTTIAQSTFATAHTHPYASSSHNHNSSYVKGNYTISKDSYGNYYIQ